MNNYKINMNIPGWNGMEILYKISELASHVPENGYILELGALFGRSTYSLGHNKHHSVSLTTIDVWSDINLERHTEVWFHDKKIDAMEEKRIDDAIKDNVLSGENFYNLWKYYTQGISNLTGIKSHTTLSNVDFPLFDFIYHDAGHDFDNVYNDLHHWWHKLKPNGILVIDDYEPQFFSELIRAVDKFVLEVQCSTEMVTNRNILLRKGV